MSEIERYAKLRDLYLHWYVQTDSDYHVEMALYAANRLDAVGGEDSFKTIKN